MARFYEIVGGFVVAGLVLIGLFRSPLVRASSTPKKDTDTDAKP